MAVSGEVKFTVVNAGIKQQGQGAADSTRKEWRELFRLWVPYVLIMSILC